MKPGNDSTSEFELFNKLDIGALVLDYRERRVLFANRYFNSLAGENQPGIVDHLLYHLDSKKQLSIRGDIKIGPGSVIGYSIYQLTETRFLVFLSDISYKEIYLQNREENQFYDKLSRIMAELVHEIGNPLTSVTTTLQVLNESIETWTLDKQREYIQRAVNEIKRLSKYLKRIREFSAANDHIRKKPVYLKSVIDRAITQNKAMLNSKHISVSCEVAQELRVEVDEDAFYQVLLNLFFNSIDILSEAGQIWIEVKEVNEFFVKLVYRNNGPPIPKEIIEKIFLPFFTTKKQGTGIGLALSLKLMTRMGGKIEVETPGSEWGTTFILYVPVSQE